MALTNWNDILNKPKGIDEVPEIALAVEQLSASVLSISEDVGEIALDVSQLSASVLSIAGDVETNATNITTLSNKIGNSEVRTYQNFPLEMVIDLGFVPSSENKAQILLLSAHNSEMVLFDCSETLNAIPIKSTNTYTISSSGSSIIITTQNRLWGRTDLIFFK